MKIYTQSFSKNNKKSKPNLKRQRNKSQHKNTLKKDCKKNKKTNSSLVVTSNLLSTRYVFLIMFVTAIALIAIYYKSILIYCEQVYHTDLLNNNTLANQESLIQELETSKDDEQDFQKYISIKILPPFSQLLDVAVKDAKNKTIDALKNAKLESGQRVNTDNVSETDLAQQDENQKAQKDTVPVEPQPIILTSNDKVFFAGDSLMQGVAPYVKKMLFKQYKIESLDLSKQSTGLAYPSAFDWPKTISDNLIADPSIKLLVVFLGANDPWDFPVKGYVKYAKFQSDLWEEHYRLRIESILNSAIEHDVQILWLAAPCMRKPKLNNAMVYLNNLYQSELEKVQQHFLMTNDLLGCTYQKFSNFVESNKAKVKVRVDDGVHFTPTGQKILAKAIMEKIIYKELEDTHSD
ncbi:hypothetical protein A9G28_01405 [Gilliamella sp. Fer1-1]|uniref:SGNH/GDSL hydrolase family protein n=1 Tax=Gilliamella sp. Fer1-1 TaxID=3120240 RepID=UPI00080DA07E|nr:SGNH/GDSL hydrolase family protein [Gilliamella apicola]OCG44958.1 hypothetical protein A9G28_01405 [Gilliamella apicola]